MSVFVSIASYCDPLLGFTMERARATARWPDGLRFAVVDQTDTPLAAPPINYVRIAPAEARGPCWARALAMSFYQGEDWFLQIDSHMDFDPGWDERLIAQAQELARGRRGVALTTYPSQFVLEDGKPVHKPITKKVLAVVLRRDSTFKAGSAVLKFEAYAVEVDDPIPAFHLGAGCLFTHGRFALELPYDPGLYFHGEEQSVFLRLYTHGWDVFHPAGMPIYHLYNQPGAGMTRPMHWDAAHDAARKVKWHEREHLSQRRLVHLLAGRPLGVYGLGKVRSLAEYAEFSGIDYPRRSLQPRAHLPVGFVITPPAGVPTSQPAPTQD
jgi:glycosyltransferase involved in cell wall biosynthesis